MQPLSGETGQTMFAPASVRSCTEKDGKLRIVFVSEADEQIADSDRFFPDPSTLEALLRKVAPRNRLSGPTRFVLKLLDSWQLRRSEAVSLLGFNQSDAVYVADVLEGLESFRGRDVNDRIAHLLCIRETLHYLFRDLEQENKWLREPHELLDGMSPLSLLLGGSMEDMLLTREYVDAAAAR